MEIIKQLNLKDVIYMIGEAWEELTTGGFCLKNGLMVSKNKFENNPKKNIHLNSVWFLTE